MINIEMIDTCYPQWLLGETIEFKNSSKRYLVCAITHTTLLIGKGDGILRTLKNTTQMIIAEKLSDDVDCDNLWTFKGQGLDVMRASF
ncbi:MAG: hypothetical protein B6I36_08400 [Desulfobacteraceae bacterium 4572_35.1]|nr:MAG: hypothetical protein B6I36_08400 [Desulfobacteraceae bacterium 4572_35.1]